MWGLALGVLLLGLWGMTQSKGSRVAFAMVVIGAVFVLKPVFGHDHSRPELDSWYNQLASGRGPCCGGPKVDATVLTDIDWESKNGQYRVRIDGKWYDVHPDAVLTGPNLDGRTLVWPVKAWWGGLTVRCFMPGPMT